MPKTLESCRKGSELIKLCETRGADIRYTKGSHVIISTDLGQVVIPNHPGDLGKGLRCKIVKTLALILAVAILAAALIACGG